VLTPAQGNAAVVVQGLPRSGNQVYQIWALKDGRPTSLGVFNVDSDAPQVVPLGQDLQNVDAVAITLEPGPNGSPGPTTTPILAAPLRS
jgi:anti-sigma-K factor RskA